MPGGRRDYARGARLRRRPIDTILIVCGGETERIYFERFRIELGNIRVQTVVSPHDPDTIVRRAIEEAKLFHYAQVWCVFDKDDFGQFDLAIEKAKRNKIAVASSNQAFELWFLLHFRRQDGPLHRSHYARELGRHLRREYSKTDQKLYQLLESKLDTAIDNAKAGCQCHRVTGNIPSKCESHTTVYLLVEQLLRWRLEK